MPPMQKMEKIPDFRLKLQDNAVDKGFLIPILLNSKEATSPLAKKFILKALTGSLEASRKQNEFTPNRVQICAQP